jgi:hypothetical protein
MATPGYGRGGAIARRLLRDNVELTAHLAAKGANYFRRNMRFALLGFWSMRTEDQ